MIDTIAVGEGKKFSLCFHEIMCQKMSCLTRNKKREYLKNVIDMPLLANLSIAHTVVPTYIIVLDTRLV